VVSVADEPTTDPSSDRPDESRATLAALEERLGLRFNDIELLRAALTHPSYANEHPEDPSPTNERLEFLGDAVLGAIVADTLYRRFEEVQEGRLTEWRAHLVCGPTLSRIATEQLSLGRWLRLGRGEEQTGGREREGNLERAYEAVVGAIYLDQGLAGAERFVERTLGEEIDELSRDPDVLNPKGALQQLSQEFLGRPEYVVTREYGPEHDRLFTVEARLGGETLGRGSGTSKQEAEKQAAREALPRLRVKLANLDQPEAGLEAGPEAGTEETARGATRGSDGPEGPGSPGSGA
jgi:ribonuclease III